jgi:ATP-dependent RNA helicase DDX10/DBP4
VLVKFPNLQQLGKRAFVTYLKSLYLQKDKAVFDLSRFSAEQFAAYAASLGLPVTPKIRFVNHKKNVPKKDMEQIDNKQMKSNSKPSVIEINPHASSASIMDDGDDYILCLKKHATDAGANDDDILRPKESITDTTTEPEQLNVYVLQTLFLSFSGYQTSNSRYCSAHIILIGCPF